MGNETLAYEIWAPKTHIYLFFVLGLISLLGSLLPLVPLFVRLLLWNFATIAFLGFTCMMYLYYQSKHLSQKTPKNPPDLKINGIL